MNSVLLDKIAWIFRKWEIGMLTVDEAKQLMKECVVYYLGDKVKYNAFIDQLWEL